MYKSIGITIAVVALAYLVSFVSDSYFREVPHELSNLSSTSDTDNQLGYMALTSVSRRVVKNVLSIEQEEV